MLIGLYILLANYGIAGFSFEFSRDWPVILIAWGILKIIDALATPAKTEDYFKHNDWVKPHIEEIVEEVLKKVKDEIKRD
ncbi:MAG: hypothetical protein HY811_02700 [Planctomycetes bacterium]|nr:hypothetical protein [Planctomycetota bacterium]